MAFRYIFPIILDKKELYNNNIRTIKKTKMNNSNKIYKILIVDDEQDNVEIFYDILSSVDNYEVSTAIDGVDALNKAESTKYDLILLDIVMPKKDGIETLDILIANPEKYGRPRVIMLTNIGGDIAIEEAIKKGAVGYRLKIDTEPDDLISMVEDELKKVTM